MRFISCCLLAVALSINWTTVAMGGAYDTRACIERNKKFGGAFATCAEDICNYDNCIERNTTTKKYEVDVKNPGSGEQALAPCEPYRQIMDRCQRANLPKKQKPKPKPWCHTGDQANWGYIKGEHDRMWASIKSLRAQRKKAQARFDNHNEAWDAVLTTVKPQAKAYHQARKAAKASKDSDRIKSFNNSWIKNGRWKRLQNFYRAGKEQLKLAKEAAADEKSYYKQIKALHNKLTPVANAMRAHDCESAYRLLQR